MATKAGSENEVEPPGGHQKWWSVTPFARKSLRQTLQDMTVHGMHQMAEQERAVWSRVLWTAGFLASLGLFLHMYYDLMVDYYSYPYKTVIVSTPSDVMPFPAISLCNINTLDVSSVSYGQPLRDLIAAAAFDESIDYESVAADQKQVLNMSAQKILEETDPGISKTFGICFYDGIKVDCKDLFDVTYWAMTRCYTLRASQLTPASATTSLRLIVNVNQPGYVVQRQKSAGVKFFVHAANMVPNLAAQTLTASPGFSTDIGVTYNKMKLLNYPFKSFGDRYCFQKEDIDLSNLPVEDPYNLLTCLKNRALQLAHDTCTCTPPFQPGSTYPACTLKQMLSCVIPILNEVNQNVFNASDRLGCPLPCEFVTYLPSITFAYFPSTEAEKMLRVMGLMDTTDDVRSNYLELNFYYSELIYRETIHQPEYTPNLIMGTLGGNLGLFLGASILSVGEILELLVALVVMTARRLYSTFFHRRVTTVHQMTEPRNGTN